MIVIPAYFITSHPHSQHASSLGTFNSIFANKTHDIYIYIFLFEEIPQGGAPMPQLSCLMFYSYLQWTTGFMVEIEAAWGLHTNKHLGTTLQVQFPDVSRDFPSHLNWTLGRIIKSSFCFRLCAFGRTTCLIVSWEMMGYIYIMCSMYGIYR